MCPGQDRHLNLAMIQTTDHSEANTVELATNTSVDPERPSGEGPSPARATPAGGIRVARPLRRIMVACLAAEAITAVLALAIVGGLLNQPAGAVPGPTDSGTVLAASEPDDDETEIDSFLLAWRRSLARDHATTGTVTRTALTDDTLFTSAWPEEADTPPDGSATVWPYRHTRFDGRQLTQIGDVARLSHPTLGRRTCLRQSRGFACSPDGDAVGGDAAVAVIEQAVRGPAATHRVSAIDPNEILTAFPLVPTDIECWEARSLSDGVGQRWGRRAQFCFHRPSGGAVFRRVLGTTRLEVLIVDHVSDSTSLHDLDPV